MDKCFFLFPFSSCSSSLLLSTFSSLFLIHVMSLPHSLSHSVSFLALHSSNLPSHFPLPFLFFVLSLYSCFYLSLPLSLTLHSTITPSLLSLLHLFLTFPFTYLSFLPHLSFTSPSSLSSTLILPFYLSTYTHSLQPHLSPTLPLLLFSSLSTDY